MKTKYFIVSEEELINLKEMENYYLNSQIDKLIKSRKPVEEIASGKVTSENRYKAINVTGPGGGSFGYINTSIKDGKPVKIFILECGK